MIRKVKSPAKIGTVPLKTIQRAVRIVSRKREIHVVRCPGGGYAVKRRGAERASRICMRPGRAIQYAKHLLRKTGGVIYHHGPDGRVLRKIAI